MKEIRLKEKYRIQVCTVCTEPIHPEAGCPREDQPEEDRHGPYGVTTIEVIPTRKTILVDKS